MDKDKTQIDIIKEKAREADAEKLKKQTVKYLAYNHETRKIETRERVGHATKPFRRIFILLAIIVVELAAAIFWLARFLTAFLGFSAAFYAVGIVFSVRVAVSGKNNDSKIAWIMFLLILAPVAVFAYLLAGEMTTTPIKSHRLKRIDEKTRLLPKAEIRDTLPPRVKQECTYIQNTSDYVAYYGGDCEYFGTGEDFFEDVIEKLKKAEKFIFMDFFILEKGHLANALFEILIAKAKEGVDVRIIVDGLGSHGTLNLLTVRRIRKSGIKIIAFEPVGPVLNLFVNYRDHRKIIVIDGKTGYTGGANIADEYVNAKLKHGTWKDAALRIDGSPVKNLTLAFLRMWEYSSRKKSDYETFIGASPADGAGGGVIMPYAGGPEEKQKLCKEVYCNIIANAHEKLYIMTPYFIVDQHIIDMLKNKALCGVDVRLVLPGIPDKKFAYSLSLHNARRAAAGGVKVYIYTPGFLHSKVMLSDDECAVVGSVNMDFRSFYQQYESAVYIAGHSALNRIADDFEKTFAVSGEMAGGKRPNIIARIWLSFLRLFAPLM